MATTTNPSSCATSSTGSYGIPIPDSSDVSRRLLSDAGRQRLTRFPSRQRRMGPAPLASFEDLSMDKTTSDSSPEEKNNILPDIGEETSTATTPVTPLAKTELSVPASPRIRVSTASSSSPHETDSKESTPEKDLISGYAKSAYCEDMSDLHSSTEELDADEEEKNRKRREIACKLAEIERKDEALRVAELNRKGSSSSVISDGLLPFTSGHSSRLSSLGSIGSARRSPSPHRMLLETSFCGSRPIQQPSIDLEDPPVTTTRLMNFTIDKIERVKSPMEAKPPDIFRSSPSPIPKYKHDGGSHVEVSTIEAEILPMKTHASGSTQDERKLPRDKEKLSGNKGKYAEVKELPITTAISPSFTEQQSTHPPRSPRHHDPEPTHRQPLSSQSSPRSPRMPKKVPVPQVPDLKDFPKSPHPPSADHHAARTTSTTPQGSPRVSRRRRTRDEVDSTSSSPSVSRKSSFTNLFRKSDNIMSPVTPDSPSSSGRKSPFSQMIRAAKKEFRSRSRSRSRSKSRERDLDDDTHDRRSVFSIFKPKSKKPKDSEKGKGNDKGSSSSDTKANEAITNVEFTFNDDGKYQSSQFGLIRQESELNRAIKEPLRGTTTPGSESEHPHAERMSQSRDSSYNELASIMNSADVKVEKDKQHIEKSKTPTDSKRRQTLEDDVFDKSQSPVPPSVQPENKAREADVNKIDKPHLPPKQKDRSSDVDTISVISTQDADSRSESERDSEIDYLKTKEKVQQKGSGATIDSPDVENKGLVSQDSIEEGELPYVPTSLPFERPLATPMVPVKERQPEMRHTQSIDRPRSTTPMTPGRLEEYKQVVSTQAVSTPDGESEKMMINIPQKGPVKVLPTKSPKRQQSKTWDDFCQEGLRSPRQLRKEYRESKSQDDDDDDTPPPLPPKVRSPARSPIEQPPIPPPAQPSEEKSTPDTVKSWINFDELPDVVLKPVRQIKTVPSRYQSQQRNQEQRRPQNEQPNIHPPRQEEQKLLKEIVHLHDVPPPRKHPPPLSATINHEIAQDSDHVFSEVSTPDKADSFEHSSDSDKPTSASSSEDLTTVRERLEEIKKEGKDGDDYENSDLERLLAPVNDCINHLSSISADPSIMDQRKSPIPDNWTDFLLPPQPGRRSRLSSLGSETGSVTGRSPSPSCMLLETSFCGSAPIDDPAAAEPDVPIAVARKLSGISLGDFSTFTTRDPLHSPNHLPCPDRTSILSDSSAEGGSPRDSDYYNRHHNESQRGQPGTQQLNPFGMDLGVRSNRSSVVSQDQSPPESPYFASYHHPP